MFAFTTVIFSIFFFFTSPSLSAEESFFFVDGESGRAIAELGKDLDERVSPCSTFKLTLALIGYETGLLIDEYNPVWSYREGYDDFLPSWRGEQAPQSWMRSSCIWYSKLLALNIGCGRIGEFLQAFGYGNGDFSGGVEGMEKNFNPFWVNSSLRISAREQVAFLQKLLRRELPLSEDTIQNSKKILFKEELEGGWRLYGKTGWSGSRPLNPHAWFVGWVERGESFFPFAYLIRQKEIDLDNRIPRVKELIGGSLHEGKGS